jgi:hypothetical protein
MSEQPAPLTAPINRPPGDSPKEKSSAFSAIHHAIDTFVVLIVWRVLTHLRIFPVLEIE